MFQLLFYNVKNKNIHNSEDMLKTDINIFNGDNNVSVYDKNLELNFYRILRKQKSFKIFG